MKKYLMTGVAAIAFCAAFTSCSKSGEDIYNPEAAGQMKADQITQAYNQAFIKYVGGPIAPNQDWGFGSAGTRAADPGDYGEWFGPNQADHYKEMGLVAPEMVSAEEEEFVANWFKTNKNPQSDPIDLSTFFVQQVYFGTKEYTGYDGNGAEHKVIGGQHMDWLCAYNPVGVEQTNYLWSAEKGNYTEVVVNHDDHINNFNTSSPQRFWTEDGTYNVRTYMAAMMLMVNSSTSRFGCKESQGTDNKVYYNYVLKELTFNGKVGYYVGFDYENHGQNGDFPKDGYYDDRIIKIVPGTGYTTPPTPPTPPTHNYTLRVLGEDLTFGEDADADFDFNDVVFDVAIENGETWIRLQAAGGTLPLYIDTKEVHALFGLNNTTTMVNTGRGSRLDPVEVKLDNYYSNAKNIPVKVTKNGITVPLTAEKGEPASKIAVPMSANFQWCAERVSIKQQYRLFTDWCTDNSFNSVWWAQ